jgi:hypothetical protein
MARVGQHARRWPSMAAYHFIIARAVSHLASTADEARQTIYEQARKVASRKVASRKVVSRRAASLRVARINRRIIHIGRRLERQETKTPRVVAWSAGSSIVVL